MIKSRNRFLGLFYGTLLALLALSLSFSQAATATVAEFSSLPAVQIVQQQLPIKIAVTTGGLALMGLELWWFLGHQPTAKSARTKGTQK